MPGHGDTISTSATLLERVKSHDADAWRRMVQLYGPLAYRWCRQSGIQASDAADIVQEVFQSVLSGVDGFRKERPSDSFCAWLRTITKNKIRDFARSAAARPKAAGGTDAYRQLAQAPDVLPNSQVELCEDTKRLSHKAVELLHSEFEGKTWQAFWRSTVKGEPAAEIAADLGMTKGAVRQAKYRVLQRLRQELDENLESG